jgi:hypothetical protein
MFVRRSGPAGKFDLFEFEYDGLGKSTAGALLAEPAVAYRGDNRIARGAIADVAAHAAAFVDISHG